MIRARKRLMLFPAAAVAAVVAVLFVINKPKQEQEEISANGDIVPQNTTRVPPVPVAAVVTNITLKSVEGARRDAEPQANQKANQGQT